MSGRRHLVAVNRTIRAEGLERSGAHAAIVQLARDVAKQMDYAGVNASGRLQERYRGVLKQLTRAAPGAVVEPPADDEPDELDAFMRRWKVRPEDQEAS